MTKQRLVSLVLGLFLASVITLVVVYPQMTHHVSVVPEMITAPSIRASTTQDRSLSGSQKNMFTPTDTLTITAMTYRSESTGSIDPDSLAYSKFWSYTPTAEESAAFLLAMKNEAGVTLQEFLTTYDGPLTTFTRTNTNDSGAVGGSDTAWKVNVSNGVKTITLYDTTAQFQTSSFPYALVQEKGEYRGEPKDSLLNGPTTGDTW